MLDLETRIPDTDYFFLGDGRTLAVLQWSRHPDASPYGLMLYDPARVSRKNGSLLSHPELGLSRTMLSVRIDEVRYHPEHGSVQARWEPGKVPAVVVSWKAGPVAVTERFHVQEGTSNLIRDVRLRSPHPGSAELEAALYANPLLFDEFGTRESSILHASGYAAISFYAVPSGRAFERFLSVPVRTGTEKVAATFIYSIDATGTHEFSLYPPEHRFPPLSRGSSFAAAPAGKPGVNPGAPPGASGSGSEPGSLAARIMELYHISKISLRAAVAQNGRFDASIWQYDFEWGMDAAMIAIAAARSGLFELSRQVLVNILRRLSSAEGMIAEAGRFRGGEMSELNGNGAVLDALWHYWRWSGDESLLHTYWSRIGAIAGYLLRPEFAHPSGLLETRRDLWERTPWMGVQRGFELAHQVYGTVGLQRAAELAAALGDTESSARWAQGAAQIREAMLRHPELSLVEDGTFIHRRLPDGSVQTDMTPDSGYRAEGYLHYIPSPPATAPSARACEPDIAEALPVIYGLVDPRSELALRTMRKLEALWSPTGTGGYARYNIDSDPDSPGPWAFATAFMAAAELETGLHERAERTIGWLLDAAGTGGSWFEYYGKRETPPYPPIGIIVWGWAQYLILVSGHIAGADITGDELRIAPKLAGFSHVIRVGGHQVTLSVRGHGRAILDGTPLELHDGGIRIRLPLEADHHLEFIP